MIEHSQFIQFIAEYGYWIAVPIMVIEGPVTTLVMGFFASLGVFDVFIVGLLSFASDMISDAFYYWTGLRGGPAVLKRLKIPDGVDNHRLQKLKERFMTHPGKIFFAAKVLTGIAHSTFVLAGVTRVDYRNILKYSIPGGLVWSFGLAFLGFYFGIQVTNISRFLSRAGLIIFGLLVLFLIYEFWLGKFLTKKYAVWQGKVNGENGENQDSLQKPGSSES